MKEERQDITFVRGARFLTGVGIPSLSVSHYHCHARMLVEKERKKEKRREEKRGEERREERRGEERRGEERRGEERREERREEKRVEKRREDEKKKTEREEKTKNTVILSSKTCQSTRHLTPWHSPQTPTTP